MSMDWCLSTAMELTYNVQVLNKAPLEELVHKVNIYKVLTDIHSDAKDLAERCIQSPEAKRYAEMLAELARRALDKWREYTAGRTSLADVAQEINFIVSEWEMLSYALSWASFPPMKKGGVKGSYASLLPKKAGKQAPWFRIR